MKTRDDAILRTVANDVRVLSAEQVARRWWSDTRWGWSRANKSLWQLAASGLLVMQSVLARPIIALESPLLSWRPGDREPAFSELAKVLHERAKGNPQITIIVFATAKTVALLGNANRPMLKITQMTHDLHVSEVFLRLIENGLSTSNWVSEDRLPKSWPVNVRPDGLVLDDDGEPRLAIEYGGDYPATRLETLHRGFESISLSYELW